MTFQTADAKTIAVDSNYGISADTLCELIGLDDLAPPDMGSRVDTESVVSSNILLAFYDSEHPTVTRSAADIIGDTKAHYYRHTLERTIAILIPFISAHEKLPRTVNTWLKSRSTSHKSRSTQGSKKKQAWATVAPMGATLASALDGDARAISILLGRSNYDFDHDEKSAVKSMLARVEQATSIDADSVCL